MGLFHPLRAQYSELKEAFDQLPVLSVQEAARKMHTRPAKVEERVRKMTHKGWFEPLTPFVDTGLDALVADRTYTNLARAYCGLVQLARELNSIQTVISRRISGRYQDALSSRPRALRNFVENIGSISSRQTLVNRSKSLIRSLLDPGSTFEPDPVENSLMETLGMIENDCYTLMTLLREHPKGDFSGFSTLITTARHQVKALEQCLPEGDAGQRISLSNSSQVRTLNEKFKYETLPAFNALLEAQMHPASPATVPGLKEKILTESKRLTVLADQVDSKKMQKALRHLADQLNQIQGAMVSDASLKLSQPLTRSLGNLYLPMMDELLTQYMRASTLGSRAKPVLNATEDLFETTLPRAMDQILDSLETDNAADMQAQAEALVKKMQLDGLLPATFQNGDPSAS